MDSTLADRRGPRSRHAPVASHPSGRSPPPGAAAFRICCTPRVCTVRADSGEEDAGPRQLFLVVGHELLQIARATLHGAYVQEGRQVVRSPSHPAPRERQWRDSTVRWAARATTPGSHHTLEGSCHGDGGTADARLPDRRLVLVVGSGRSGTSTVSGAMKMLGMHVPQPEIPSDKHNPRGYFEPAWVIAFHKRQLARAGLVPREARPDSAGRAARSPASWTPRQSWARGWPTSSRWPRS